MKLLQTLKLSNTQKEVLCKIKASETPVLALEQLNSENMQTALDILSNLGVVVYDDENIDITEKGESLMKDYNLIDDMGELTEEGQLLAMLNNNEAPNMQQPPMQNNEVGAFESYSLLKQII